MTASREDPTEAAFLLIRTASRDQLEAAARIWAAKIASAEVMERASRQVIAHAKAKTKELAINGVLPHVATCPTGHEYWTGPATRISTCPLCMAIELRSLRGRMRALGISDSNAPNTD